MALMTTTAKNSEVNLLRLGATREIFPRDQPPEVDLVISRLALAALQRLGPQLVSLPPVARQHAILREATRLWDELRGELVSIGTSPPRRVDEYVRAVPIFAGVITGRLERLLFALLDAGSLRKTLMRERAALDAALAKLPELDG